ncbi:MAG: DUF1365 domain-containing protein [Alphaproteobacteria bacterium]
MGIEPKLLFGKVMHARLFPKQNRFSYGIYYLALPLSHIGKLPIARNRFAPLSFYDRDHGACDGSNLGQWARSILKDYGIKQADGEIILISMPRILGYVFNPVSFWLCHDRQGTVRAVLCEVHNTFGERHTYLCANADHAPITAEQTVIGRKLFHVSPFLQREGYYKFRFDVNDQEFRTKIDYYNANNEKQLVTSLTGRMESMNKPALKRAFWGYPLVTLKAITLIHWQALKLFIKGIKYIPRPEQKPERVSATQAIEK